MQVSIRRATEADIDWIIPQLKFFSAFYGTKLPPFGDESYARTFIADHIQNHLFLVAEKEDGTLLGFISGLVTPHVYNPAIKTLAETFWWVEEKFRGSVAGKMLLDAFVNWGRDNVNWITFTLEHHSPVSELPLLRKGFKFQEKTFLLEVV